MPFWKGVVLAILAIPRCVYAAGDDEPQQNVDELPPDDHDDGMEHSVSPEQLQKIHAKMDGDSNGKVSMDEVLQFSDMTRRLIAGKDIKTVLEEMDSDKDGKLTLADIHKDMEHVGEDHEGKKEASIRKAVEERKFKAADADGDGLLSEVELPAMFYPESHEGVLQIAAQATLEQKDIDKDGLLTAKEFWEGDLRNAAPEEEGEDIAASEEEVADFKSLDKDGSGKLDLEELKAWESGRFHTHQAMQKFFEKADTDNDLHLSSEELAGSHGILADSEAQYHFMEWTEHHEL